MAESVQGMPCMVSSVKNTSASYLGALYDLGSHLGDCVHTCQSFGSYCSFGCPTSWSVSHWARGANKIAMAHSMSTHDMSLWSSYKSRAFVEFPAPRVAFSVGHFSVRTIMALQFLAGNPLFCFVHFLKHRHLFLLGMGWITSHEHFTTTHSFL